MWTTGHHRGRPSTATKAVVAFGTVVALAALGLGGCGDSTTAPESAANNNLNPAQPQVSGGFASDQFAGVPAPSDGTADSEPVTQGNTTTQSFRVPGAAADAIRSYAQLAGSHGWEVITPPTSSGSTDWTMTLTRDGQELLVTAAPATGGSGASELSLEVSST